MNTLPSLTIFFPFYNDAGTVEKAITQAYEVGKTLTKDLEVIAIHGGPSKDDTYEKILKQKKVFPSLTIIDKKDNTEGYAVIKHGFAAATKDWVFYTDGDLQYDLNDLKKLVQVQAETKADVINGYKTGRHDSLLRIILGKAYAMLSQLFFHLPIHDVDCDFRLIRRSCLNKIILRSANASILPELIIKLKKSGSTFVEVPVSHKKRIYGMSNYTSWNLFREKLTGDLRLWQLLKKDSY